MNRFIGRIVMYGIFVLMGVLLYSSFMKTFFISPNWSLEMAQFIMVAYYLMGGPYSMQEGAHVRMDLLYDGWSDRTRAMVDVVTVLMLGFYLIILLYGGLSSTGYALKYGEESYSSWAPQMAPIKIVMCIGIFLMILQALSSLLKNIAKLQGEPLT